MVGTRPEVSDEQLAAGVVEQLRGWWGPQVDTWRHLRTYRISFAQPNQVRLRKVPSSHMGLWEPLAALARVGATLGHGRGATVFDTLQWFGMARFRLWFEVEHSCCNV